jgi:DNA-directed RNA polymerase subunit RPC12/RpoP
MSFKAAKCPNCAGDIQVPDDRDTVKCMYCGSDIVVREAIRLAGGVNIEEN